VTTDAAEEIIGMMATSAVNRAGQLVQTRYRLQLAEQWGIAPGMRILEIACGQGDMTAVLAHMVGPDGHITAVDIADPSYGAPISLGESAAQLQSSPIGLRIDFCYQFDILDPTVSFPDDAFDAIVLAHGAWYFDNVDQLRRTLTRVRPWSERLLFAEWNFAPESYDQIAHFLAVTIQGQIEVYKSASEANVRTPFSRERLTALLTETGWDIANTSAVDTSTLQDGDWEVDLCLNYALPEAELLEIPPRIKNLLTSQGDVLRSLATNSSLRPLSAYTLSALRRVES
jgi:SAM-dependent methyltransferase